MSAVCVLTPVVIASWPAISAAAVAAAASMGFALRGAKVPKVVEPKEKTVETAIENSEVVAEGMAPGEQLVVTRDKLTIRIGRDVRGRCTVCVTGCGQSDRALRKIGEDIAGRIVQQHTYNKLLTELKARAYTVVGEEMLADQSVKVRVRL